MARQILTYLTQHHEAMLQHLYTLIRAESPSQDKAAVDAAGHLMARLLAEVGAEVSVIPDTRRGNIIRAEWPGADTTTQVLLLGHIDTVFDRGELTRNPLRRDGDILYGPGVSDMKGGLVCLLWALRALRALGRTPRRTVVALITGDEEIGSETARPFITAEAARSVATLVLEPALPDGAVKAWRKGRGQFSITAAGRAAHSGADPKLGVNAIVEMAHQILRLTDLDDPGTGLSVNVGTMTGGTRANVIPDHATAEIDVRVATSDQGRRVESALQRLQPVQSGATLKVEGAVSTPPLEPRHSEPLLPALSQVYAELGLELKLGGSGGVSDGNLAASTGCATLDGLGPIGDGMHTSGEYMRVSSLWERTAVVARLLELV